MPAGEVVLYDRNNGKLKLLDSSDALKHSLKLKDNPWDISVVDAKTVIVTLPWKQQLQYIEVFPQLVSGRVLQLDKKCWDVHVTGDKIFTSCHNDSEQGDVRILDLDGNLLQQLGINQDGTIPFTTPYNITVCPLEKTIFVSDTEKAAVTCMTMDNHVIYQYLDKEMKFPVGSHYDSGDNILFSDYELNNIQMITAEGKKHCDLVSSKDALKLHRSISFRESNDTLIVGCAGLDHVFLFKLGKGVCWYFSHEPSSLFHHSVLVNLCVSMMMH